MTPIRLVLSAGLVLTFAVLGAPSTAQSPAPAPAAAAAPATAIDPEAVQALTRMSAYLKTLTAFEITADTSVDLVLDDGQTVTLDGVNRYLIRRPDAAVVEVATPWRKRRLIYDGKRLTVHAPELKYYATVDAPPTIRATMEAAQERYGLTVPLAELFRWADPGETGSQPLTGAMVIGPARVGGVDTIQYAFRENDIDWQVWIQTGAQPVPRKFVIIDTSTEDAPQYEARLSWNMSPTLTSNSFSFTPAKDDKLIRLSTLNAE